MKNEWRHYNVLLPPSSQLDAMTAPLLPLFARLTHGVYVIGVGDSAQKNVFTAAWLTQASFDPPLIALSINPEHRSYALLKAGGGFTVNVLPQAREDLARHCGKPGEKLAGIAWRASKQGWPLLEAAMAWLACAFAAEMPAGDHSLVLGRVLDGGLIDPTAQPLLYRPDSGMDRAAELLPAALAP
jgi:flavin reductase (DIM6/NTAB) family NADH-FMN oxidoreductase RutF